MLALVAAAGGIGDVVRATPLVRVCSRLGYDVDFVVAADYLAVGDLLRGAPEVRRLSLLPSPWCRERAPAVTMDLDTYDLAVVTTLASPLRARIRARRALTYDTAQWRREGDVACARAAAATLGWTEPLPAPFVRPSARRFDLHAGTLALHAGCKPGWGWKRWHGFAELAALLEHVVVVGTTDDERAEGAYFDAAPAWPDHVSSYVGRLSLADTAALLAQCTALVSNDSGLMHVAAALGVPTVGVFGITSPARELMQLPNVMPITKGLPCEPTCRLRPWGRRDCEHHLRCLRTLEAGEVLTALRAVAPGVVQNFCGADA